MSKNGTYTREELQSPDRIKGIAYDAIKDTALNTSYTPVECLEEILTRIKRAEEYMNAYCIRG